MKTVCVKHGMAYEVSQGCLYCEPVTKTSVPVAPTSFTRYGETRYASDVADGLAYVSSMTHTFTLSRAWGGDPLISTTLRQSPVWSPAYYKLNVNPGEYSFYAFISAIVEQKVPYIQPFVGPQGSILDHGHNAILGSNYVQFGTSIYGHSMTFIHPDTVKTCGVLKSFCKFAGHIP